MDITQLGITVVAVVGVALVGVMAVIPSVMEAAAARGEAGHLETPPTRPAPRRRVRHRPVDLAA